MTVDTTTLTGSGNGTSIKIGQWSPNAGELWYIDYVLLTCDGTGVGNYRATAKYGVHHESFTESDLSVTEYQYSDRGAEVEGNAPSATPSTGYATVGSYITENENLLYGFNDTDGSNCELLIHLRRVI